MMTRTTIHVVTSFVAFHRWKDAPEEVAFLRNWHRHVFNVRFYLPVSHDNRAIEFFMFRREADQHIAAHYSGAQFEFSCEQIAKQLLAQFPQCVAVEVKEDDENGAIVERV